MKNRLLLVSILVLSLISVVTTACGSPGLSTGQSAPSQAANANPAGYAKPDVLVDTAWVKAHLQDAKVRLIDLSGKPDTYTAGHIPGAVYTALNDYVNPADPIKGQIMTRDALSALMSKQGVKNSDTIVFYDDGRNLSASRAYWVLKYYSHSDVRIYNGGSVKWVADGEKLVKDEVKVTPSTYAAGTPDESIRTDWNYVVSHVGDPSVMFCDARGPKEYAGTDVRSAQGGHIPDAINIDWVNNVNDDGTFKSKAALTELYAKAGFTADKEVITYCQTGVRAADTWFVLRELLGFPKVRNYDGSWEEYGNRPDSKIQK
ncbi:MAG: sulfurtransferase [Chloroflexi bacterium]|nr:sulfurtransferase [Chloroflexota bacterium]